MVHASIVPNKKAMERFGFSDLPTGAVVGEAELVDVKKYKTKKEFLAESELHMASSDFGNYGFVLKNCRRIGQIPAKGKLGFWDFDK